MRSSGSHGGHKYCHNGGTAFAHEHGHRLLALGSNMAIMAPSGAPLETAGLQGKYRRVQGSVPFGGSDGLVCLFFSDAEKYCHDGGRRSFLQARRVSTPGVQEGNHGPSPRSPDKCVWQEKRKGPGIRAFGDSNGVVRLRAVRQSCDVASRTQTLRARRARQAASLHCRPCRTGCEMTCWCGPGVVSRLGFRQDHVDVLLRRVRALTPRRPSRRYESSAGGITVSSCQMAFERLDESAPCGPLRDGRADPRICEASTLLSGPRRVG